MIPDVIENPSSGERIRILRRPEASGDALVWELVLAPGGQVPSSHAHPRQAERFCVVEGELRFRLGRRRLRLVAGQSVTVAPGQVHHFANRGPVPALVHVETAPALDMEALLQVAAALARDGHQAGRPRPHLVDLALFMQDFRAEVAAPAAPAAVAVAIRPFARLVRSLGRDRRYRQLRARSTGAGWPARP
jgi:mannose-6-phosphate isomerase-like protein (cupin superfamily)